MYWLWKKPPQVHFTMQKMDRTPYAKSVRWLMKLKDSLAHHKP
jgi:hypothetical protein